MNIFNDLEILISVVNWYSRMVQKNQSDPILTNLLNMTSKKAVCFATALFRKFYILDPKYLCYSLLKKVSHR